MTEVQILEAEIMEKSLKLARLRAQSARVEIKNYKFRDMNGEVSLLDLFGGKDILFLIHNMGQGCRYCTLWADGLNGFVSHLESKFALALASKDEPNLQRAFANSRGWRFRMVSHAGGEYIREQSVYPGDENGPGIVAYEREGNKIYKKNSAGFGPGDLYASIWHILGLAGFNEETWTPQYSYWKPPQIMDDGGKNLL